QSSGLHLLQQGDVMKLSDIRIDAATIEVGDWIDDLPFPGLEGVRLNVRGIGNADYRRLQSKLFRDASAKRIGPENADDFGEKVTNELLSKTVLLGWDGIFEEDGTTPLKFTPDLALQLLSDPELSTLRNAVTYAANLLAGRRKKPAESDLKN
ncbi:MAG TPA: hypothetical protein VFW56_08385, partial [Bradyrhizobium sp.]|nr:hypothetical protein [Bradyrhizobium sp.]